MKNKLFFFANVELEKVPQQVVDWRPSTDGVADPDNYISQASVADMQRVADHLRNHYGYDQGSYDNFPADETNLKVLGRIDWNINDSHKLAVRYNYTKNKAWNPTNGSSGNLGYRLNQSRISQNSIAFSNSPES